ncbi:hypothetical protein HD554DRAFT_2036254 [Boletus coccyginus]|nr:hypothetical protein HD554DRAFT_2036254 [Boletus coccyginus]
MSIHKTCLFNVNKHLGWPDLSQKRRTPAEKKADDELMANAQAEREVATSQALQRVSKFKAKMKDEQAMATVAKPVCPTMKKKPYNPKPTKGEKPQMIGGMEVLPCGDLLNSTFDNEVIITKDLPDTIFIGGFDDKEMVDDIFKRVTMDALALAEKSQLLTIVSKVEPPTKSVKTEALHPAKKVKADPESSVQSEGSNSPVAIMLPIEMPLEFFKQDTWKWRIIPTLCLWATAQSNIWGISKQQITGMLKNIIAVAYPQAPKLVEQVTMQLNVVVVTYQHLCDCNSTKALKSHFMIHLVATTYLPYIKGWIHIPSLDYPTLHHSEFKGILGLCGATVSTNVHAFSDQNWEEVTRKLTAAAAQHNDN